MQRPVAVPLAESGDRIAGLVLALEESPLPSLTLTTIAVRGLGGTAQAYVICHLHDGSRERFSPSDARLIAVALRDAAGVMRQLDDWADSLDEAADTADRQASAILLGDGEGRGVRGFGPPPTHPYWRERYAADQLSGGPAQ